jgi:hypothetical protein
MTTQTDDELMAKAAGLAKAIAPQRDLWPGIEAAIGKSVTGDTTTGRAGRHSWTPWFAQAAAVLLLVGGSSFVTYTLMDRQPVVIERPVAGGLVLEQASFGGQYELSTGYKLARTNLQTQMQRELEKLSPEARAGVEQNLAVIRNAIAEINAALEQEPGNALLQEQLLKTYREELAVMRKVGGLTQDVMSRNDI